MTTIQKDITIELPIDKVYKYVDDPTHFPEFWPSMIEVKDIEVLPNGGHRFQWLYKMAGARFEGVSETLEHALDERIVDKTKGPIESTFKWTFVPEAGKTKVRLAVDYELPTALLGKLPEKFLHKLNEREAESMLVNLKDRLEV